MSGFVEVPTVDGVGGVAKKSAELVGSGWFGVAMVESEWMDACICMHAAQHISPHELLDGPLLLIVAVGRTRGVDIAQTVDPLLGTGREA